MEYYERLKLIRIGKDITQKEIGKYVGVSKQQYNKYEKGIHLMPIPYLISACKYLNVSADYILGLGKHMIFPPFEQETPATECPLRAYFIALRKGRD